MVNKYFAGLLILIIAAAAISILLPQEVKISVGASSTTFSLWNDISKSWYVGGIETSKLYNGTKLIKFSRALTFSQNSDNFTNITRTSNYGSVSLVDNYEFNGNLADKEQIPISETHRIQNGKGLIYQYQVSKLPYGYNADLTGKTSLILGKMKIEWDAGNYYAKLTNLYTGGKLIIKYRIASDDEIYNIRLFDPIAKFIGHDNLQVGTKSEFHRGYKVNFTHVNDGITEQAFDVSISNIRKTIQTETPVFSVEPLTYGIDKTEFTVFELQNNSRTVPHYISVLTPKTCYNPIYNNITGELISNNSYDCSYPELVQKGTDTIWETSYAQLNPDSESNDNIKKSKNIKVDFASFETKNYRVVILTPLGKTSSGYGSSGILTVQIGGNTFYDTTNSSWWNNNYGVRYPIPIPAISTLNAGYTINLTWNYSTYTKCANTGNDTRVVIDDGTNTLEIDRNITNNGTVYASLEFAVNSIITGGTTNSTYYVYCQNPTAGNPPNNKSKVYDFYDDFSSGTLAGRWDIVCNLGSCVTPTVQNVGGKWMVSMDSNPGAQLTIRRNNTNGQNMTAIVRMSRNNNNQGTNDNGIQLGIDNTTFTSGSAYLLGAGSWVFNLYNTTPSATSFGTSAANTFYNFKATVIKSVSINLSVDGQGYASLPEVSTSSNTFYGIYVNGWNSLTMNVSEFIMIQAVQNPPTITIGSEETSASPPQWSANATSPNSPQVYSPTAIYGFQINWSGADNSTFTLGTPQGTSTAYTKLTEIAVVNNSAGVYWINFTQPQLGSTGTYNFSWTGINNTGSNTTNTWNYQINQPPQWSANATSKTSPQTYNPSNNYGFQISWSASAGFANATFQLGRLAGTLTNYTITTTPATNNSSAAGANVWYINLTQEQFGGAGNYNYTWFGTDTIGLQNATQTVGYVINQNPTNPINLWMSNATNHYLNQNISLTYPGITNASLIQGVAQSGTFNLYRDDLLANSANNMNMSLSAGARKMTGNTTGNANYSGNSTTWWFNIFKGSSLATMLLNNSLANQIYFSDQVTNMTGNCSNAQQQVGLYLNATGFGNNFTAGKGAVYNTTNASFYHSETNYNATAVCFDNGNYSQSSDFSFIENDPGIDFYLNSTLIFQPNVSTQYNVQPINQSASKPAVCINNTRPGTSKNVSFYTIVNLTSLYNATLFVSSAYDASTSQRLGMRNNESWLFNNTPFNAQKCVYLWANFSAGKAGHWLPDIYADSRLA